MTELWVARDGTGTWVFRARPVQNERDLWHSQDGDVYERIPTRWLNLKPGECRRLVLSEEKSE